ncbi:tetratricopeptide repeat protein [bacterium]|jgi:tetratricopeptide (TPR) repeat protein|nr:tetratricopeptide repeat protein [bacterium]
MSEETSSVVSFSGLIVVVLCAVFGLYLLMPDDRQMTDRLMEDGKYESALEMLESMDPEQKAANLEFYQTTKFRLKRMLVDVAEQDLIQGLLKEAVASYREVGEKAEELFVELIKLLQMLTDPLGAFAIIEPAIDELPIASRTELYRHLSELALAREEPVLAAEIFSRYLLDNISDPNAVWESARLWRMAALPGDAIEAIETFSIANVTNLFVEHERLFVLKVHLFRELSQPQTAFDELNEVLAGKDQFPVESPAVKEELAEVYIKAGIESENGLLVLPFLESYLRMNPSNYELLEQLAVIYIQETRFDDAIEIYLRLTKALPEEFRLQETLAQIYEWNEQVGKAYDLYLVIASPERIPAIDRLKALHRPMYRTQEFEPVLRRVLPIEGRSDLTLEHARVLTRLGRYDLSLDRYEEYLKKEPSNGFAVVEMSDLAFESFYYDRAEKHYRRAIELLPSELGLRKRLGESLYLDSRYEEAFDYYKDYLESNDSFDLEMVQTFSRLAQSLGKYDDVSAGLVEVLKLKENPNSEDFLALARNYYYRKDYGKQSVVLEQALDTFPDDSSLVYFLGLSYSAQKQFLQVSAMIEKNQKSLEDPKVYQLYVEVLIANQEYKKALKVAQGALTKEAFESTAMKQNLAQIYEGNQMYLKASEVLRELHRSDPSDQSSGLALANVLSTMGKRDEAKKILAPYLEQPSPSVLQTAAALAAMSGEFKQAEEYQLAYLEMAEEPTFYDYGFLGDIRLELGEANQAKADYEVTLLKMLNEVITPEQASNN